MKTPATAGKRRSTSVAGGNPYSSYANTPGVKAKPGDRSSRKELRESAFNLNREIAVSTYMNGVR